MIPFFQLVEWKVGLFSIQSWGTFVALGFLAGIFGAVRETKKRRLDPRPILDLSTWMVLSAFIGARIFYLLGNLNLVMKPSVEILKIWEGGFGIYGGFLGAVIAFAVMTHRKKIPFWPYAEAFVFGLPLGIAIGRIGCFLIHDHIGKITTFPLGMKYLDGTVRHETSFYEILAMVVLFVFFLFSRKFFWSRRVGFYTFSFFLWYGGIRFLLDFLRSEDLVFSDPRWYGWTPSQYVSLLAAGVAIVFFLKFYPSIRRTS